MKFIKISEAMNGRTRFRIGKVTGFVAKRKYKSRGWGIEKQNTFTQLHLGKTSIAVERRNRHTWNFTG
jgi:hypothetical protein